MSCGPTRRAAILGLAAAAAPWAAAAARGESLVLIYDTTRFKLAPSSRHAFVRSDLYRGPRAAASVRTLEGLAELFAAGTVAMALASRAVAADLVADSRLSLGVVA